MNGEIVELDEDVSGSPLYSKDLAPTTLKERTWSKWNLAAIWVGMAVCIPTYILASYMIKSGLSWQASLIIIALANLIITVPMVLNGHAGVKYGIPFPVLGRASFGTKGIHIASVVRGIVACGWFGIQTWIGGLAIYAIWNAVSGQQGSAGLDVGKFIGFALFWLINMFFIWKGTESIRWLEDFAAPILILMGVVLIVWGANQAGGFFTVLDQGKQFQTQTAVISTADGEAKLLLQPLTDLEGNPKASQYKLSDSQAWKNLPTSDLGTINVQLSDATAKKDALSVQFKSDAGDVSSAVVIATAGTATDGFGGKIWQYVLWLTAMVGFWATMSLSIADITRYAATQKDQMAGQFIGLPGTMVLYSFVGIFVTFSAVINFSDILVVEDAPWDPVSFLAKFDSPTVVIISQIFMLIATLSTNIAANVIAPANAFSNLSPKKISFKMGGLITGILGIIICPWWLLNEISGILIFISGLLGPVLGILLCDYYVIRKKRLALAELYKTNGEYSYGGSGFNKAAIIALVLGVLVAVIGYWVPSLVFLYNLSWFTGFIISFAVYYFMMKDKE